jgi:hypothetical protein
VVFLEHIEVILTLFYHDVSWLFLCDYQEKQCNCQSDYEIGEGQISVLWKVLKEYEGNVQDVVGQEKRQ